MSGTGKGHADFPKTRSTAAALSDARARTCVHLPFSCAFFQENDWRAERPANLSPNESKLRSVGRGLFEFRGVTLER